MTTWKGRTENGVFSAVLEAPVLDTLDRYCRNAGSSETGGILVGRYSDDRSLAIVREATPPPPDSKRGRSWFVRGVSGLRDLLAKRWWAMERSFYVGEWHFHPVNHVDPSPDDFAQMFAIADARQYECKEPLLIILGLSRRNGARALRGFVCPAGRDPLELIPDGEPA